MKLRYKIGGAFVALLAVGVLVLALVLSHNSDCTPAPGLSGDQETMKAITYRCYGSADVLEYGDVAKPAPGDHEILVRVKAAAVNPLDWHYMRGEPYVMRLMGAGLGAPGDPRLGVDFSGIVEAVGEGVERFKPGDEVFGGRTGAFAEYLTIPADRAVVLKPANMNFQQAASVPIAAVTALQALRDSGNLQAGEKVLINGASGGVGTFAVQIAKAMGAVVTGVCSTRNVDMVRAIGADHVIDYKKESYTDSGQEFDLIVDMVGNHSLGDNRKVMTPGGRFVSVGGGKGSWIGPLMRPVSILLYSPFVDQEFSSMLARMRQDDLQVLADMMREGDITPVLDRQYTLAEVPEAIRYSEEGHARGKIIIGLDGDL